MHSDAGTLGGDLRRDTVTIIGGALDLQEKVVKQAMTPIENVFMLSIDARLDFDTLRKICKTGHSRIPVYEEVDIPAPMAVAGAPVVSQTSKGAASVEAQTGTGAKTIKAKKIVGILLVKQCVLLDPADATPVRKIPLNKVPIVPHNEPLLGILDKFQEGRSHMAIVSHFSAERAQSVKKAVKQGLTQRLRSAIRDTDSEDESSSSSDEEEAATSSQKRWHLRRKKSDESKDNASTGSANTPTLHESAQGSEEEGSTSLPKKIRGLSSRGKRKHKHKHRKPEDVDLELGEVHSGDKKDDSKTKSILPGFSVAPSGGFWGREQDMPADAVLSTKGAEEFLQIADPAVMPLGIITLEDVLEGASHRCLLLRDLTDH